LNGAGPDNDEHTMNVDPLVGKVLCGRFRIVRLLARGGMGKVYEAIQEPLGRQVALKVLDIHGGGDEFRQRFFKEAATCAKLSHPHTVRIYDYGQTDDGIFFIAMEYLQGRTLHDLLVAEAPLDPLRVIRIFRRMCGALAEAHDTGIIHRDLKPANVYLTEHGDSGDFVKVIDFGLVKEMGVESELSRTGNVLGSPLYMSPEQVHGTDVDPRTDVYAVGLMMFTALMGKTAFKRGNPLAVLMAQVQKAPPPFSEANPAVQVSGALEWIVQTCIEKPVENRFVSMHELLRGLKAAEKEIRGEVSAPLVLGLEEGVVVLPEGVDITSTQSSVNKVPAIGSGVGAALPSNTTLVGSDSIAQHLSSDPQPTQTVVVLGRSSAVAIGVLAVALVLMGGMIGKSVLGSADETELPTPAPEVRGEAAHLKVQLLSLPSGAEVEHVGAYLGITPVMLSIPEGEVWALELKAEGHETKTVEVTGASPEVTVKLTEVEEEVVPEVPQTSAPDPKAPPAPRSDRRGDIADPWGD
jgi:eukaryotic-like serine/threonine-protein kinase